MVVMLPANGSVLPSPLVVIMLAARFIILKRNALRWLVP